MEKGKLTVSIGFFFVFLVLMVFYLKTLLPTVGFWDTGELQTIAYTFDIGHPTGYPTYIILGKTWLSIFPFGSVAWRMNVFSAICVSLACGFLFLFMMKITKNIATAFLAGLIFGLDRQIWDIATRAEVHSLHLLFTTIIIYIFYKIMVEKKPELLSVLSFIMALSLGNHMLSVFFIPLFGLILLLQIKSFSVKLLINSVLLYSLGLSVYLLLPILSLVKDPLVINYKIDNLANFYRHVFGSDFSGFMHEWTKNSFKETILYYFSSLKVFLPSVFLIPVAIGFFAGLKRFSKFTILILILFLSTLYFSLHYQNAILERYFITSFLIIIIWGFIGLSFAEEIIGHFYLSEFPIRRISRFFILLLLIFVLWREIKTNFPLVDQSHNYQALAYAKNTLKIVPKNSVIFSWWSYSTPLWYLTKVEKIRNDVTVINDSQNRWLELAKKTNERRPVYFIEKIPIHDQGYVLEPAGTIFLLKKKNLD